MERPRKPDLFVAPPPYREFRRLPAAPRRWPPGTVLGIAVSDPRMARTWLPAVLPSIRARHPDLPPVVWFRGSIGGDALRLARRLGALHVRGVVVGVERIDAALRPSMTHPARLAADVTEWLRLRGITPPPGPRGFITGCFSRMPTPRRIRDVQPRSRIPVRTQRARFAAAGLPGPGAWVSLARGLRTSLALQARPNVALLPASLDLGYTDHSSLSRHLRRLFQLRPTEIRARLGWEWLLERWLRDQRLRGYTAGGR